jgi:pSer/pThr/pTyr-binding forkhead associated (FHA) protein
LLLGSSIAFCIAAVVDVLTSAWLQGLPGSKFDGQVYHLDKFREPNEAVIGSDGKGAVNIWVPGAEGKHASISLTGRGAWIRHLAATSHTLVNGDPITDRRLRSGDIIEIARVRMVYRERTLVGHTHEKGSLAKV